MGEATSATSSAIPSIASGTALAGGLACALAVAGGRRRALLVSVGIAVTRGRLTALADGEAAWESARVPSVRVLGVKCVK